MLDTVRKSNNTIDNASSFFHSSIIIFRIKYISTSSLDRWMGDDRQKPIIHVRTKLKKIGERTKQAQHTTR